MRTFTYLACVAILTSACAALDPGTKAVKLKDGSTLYVDKRGNMRMRDVTGHKVYMQDGVPMEAADGTVIIMKEDPTWKVIRLKGSLNPKL
ncbi:MAG: CopK family periplasmic copper-binding protein [Burkholderiales bacterium]|nr:CopK family periplasmic copper-binding protein [Burkholderiales bacterium]